MSKPRVNRAPPVSDEDLDAESAAFREMADSVSFVAADGAEVKAKPAAEPGDDPIEDGLPEEGEA